MPTDIETTIIIIDVVGILLWADESIINDTSNELARVY